MAVILDMDMPKECSECRFFGYEGILCKSTAYFLKCSELQVTGVPLGQADQGPVASDPFSEFFLRQAEFGTAGLYQGSVVDCHYSVSHLSGCSSIIW